jgi:anti-anti-sigma factor
VLRLEAAETGDTITLAIAGDLDFATEPELASCLRQLAYRGPGRLVLDMSQVPVMDCASARLIARMSRSLADGRGVTVRRAEPAIHRVMQITGLGAYVEFED